MSQSKTLNKTSNKSPIKSSLTDKQKRILNVIKTFFNDTDSEVFTLKDLYGEGSKPNMQASKQPFFLDYFGDREGKSPLSKSRAGLSTMLRSLKDAGYIVGDGTKGYTLTDKAISTSTEKSYNKKENKTKIKNEMESDDVEIEIDIDQVIYRMNQSKKKEEELEKQLCEQRTVTNEYKNYAKYFMYFRNGENNNKVIEKIEEIEDKNQITNDEENNLSLIKTDENNNENENDEN